MINATLVFDETDAFETWLVDLPGVPAAGDTFERGDTSWTVTEVAWCLPEVPVGGAVKLVVNLSLRPES